MLSLHDVDIAAVRQADLTSDRESQTGAACAALTAVVKTDKPLEHPLPFALGYAWPIINDIQTGHTVSRGKPHRHRGAGVPSRVVHEVAHRAKQVLRVALNFHRDDIHRPNERLGSEAAISMSRLYLATRSPISLEVNSFRRRLFMNVRRLSLDVDKAVARPGILDLAEAIEAVSGAEAVNVTFEEIDIETVGMDVTVEGDSIDVAGVIEAIEKAGAAVHTP